MVSRYWTLNRLPDGGCRKAGRTGAVVLVALGVLGVASMADAQVTQTPPPVGPGFQAILSQDGLGVPDVSGAVGEDRVIATVNSRLRVQDKAGNAIGTEQSFSTFWGNASVQHSRIVYVPDAVTPDDSLWVHAAVDTGNGRLLLAVFRGRQPDPSSANWGTWQKKTDLALPPFVPDFVSVGFNRHWVVLVASSETGESNLYVFDRAQLRDQVASGWSVLQVFDVRALEGLASAAESPAPALTYDANEPDLYLVRVRDRSTGTVRLLRVTSAAPPSSPVLQLVGESTLPQGPWAGDIPNPNEEAPQIQTATPAFLVETGDDRVQSVVVDESGDIWATNTVFLAGPRAAVQWWAARDDGSLLRSGRIDDATGRRFFAYPQIAVNANGDALVGYSSFSPTERVGASYSLLVRRSDGTYEQRGDRLLKAGSEVASYGTCSPCLSEWGRYNTVARDVAGPDFWTLQELPTFSVTPRWETWWGRVDSRPFITVSDATASEPPAGPPGQARFKVALSWPSSQEVRVDVVTEDGSATAPADYGGISSLTLVLAPGETQRWVDVPVYYDGSCETTETFTLRLTNPVNAWLGETRVASLGATGTVLENPPPPTIAIQDVRVVERTGAGTWDLTLTVAASAEPCGVTTVDYGTREGSASSGTDFASTSGSLTLGPGQAAGLIDVPIFQDSVLEGDEQFYVDLSFPGAAYATLPRTRGVVTIRDDDDSGLWGQVEFLSITSDSQGTGPTSGRTRLRWRNPVRATTQHVHVRWQDDGTCPPGGGSSCTGACHDVEASAATGGSPETGAYDHVGLELGRTYCYVIFASDDTGTAFGVNQTISGRPFDASGAARWRFETNAGSSLGSPSIGKDAVLALMGNELHATVRDPAHADAGTWPAAWRPVKLGTLDQVRFPVLPVRGRWRAFIATLMGRVFSVDAETGAILWTTDLAAAPWSTETGAPPAGMFRQYGGPRDLLLLGTRRPSATNSLVALDPFTGAVLQSHALTGTTGLVTTAPTVDYATRRVYFTVYDSSPTNANLYCLQLNDAGVPFSAANPVWKVTVPTATDGPPATTRDELTTSPILRNGRIYVGDARGAVYSVRASDGGDIRRLATGSGASVLGFLFPDRSGDALYFTTGDRAHKVLDNDASGLVFTTEPGWPVSINPTATMPLFYRRQSLPGFAWSATGGFGATRLFRIEGGSAVEVADLGVSDTPGQPTLDSAFGVMHIGTTAGSLFGASVSLP